MNEPPKHTLKKAFLTGILILLPAVLTFGCLAYLFHLSTLFIPPLIPLLYKGPISPLLMMALKFGGLLTIIIFITGLGLLAQHAVFKKLGSWGERILIALPIIKPIYQGLKQIADIFRGGKTNLFKQVVLIEYPKENSYAPAFLTADASESLKKDTGGLDLVGVYVPTTPNPTSGFLLYIPREKVIPVSMTSTEAMTLIMSGGIAAPKKP